MKQIEKTLSNYILDKEVLAELAKEWSELNKKKSIYYITDCPHLNDQLENVQQQMLAGDYYYRSHLVDFEKEHQIDFINLALKDRYEFDEYISLNDKHQLLRKMVLVWEGKITTKQFFKAFKDSFLESFEADINEALYEIGERIMGTSYSRLEDKDDAKYFHSIDCIRNTCEEHGNRYQSDSERENAANLADYNRQRI